MIERAAGWLRGGRLHVLAVPLFAGAALGVAVAEPVAAQVPPPRLLADVDDRAEQLQPWTPFGVGGLALAELWGVEAGESPTLEDASFRSTLWRRDGTAPGTFQLLPDGISFLGMLDVSLPAAGGGRG